MSCVPEPVGASPSPFGQSSSYEAYTTSYSSTKTLGVAIETVGESLKSSGKVYYIGCGVAATVGFIDASEMRPTFGAPASKTVIECGKRCQNIFIGLKKDLFGCFR